VTVRRPVTASRVQVTAGAVIVRMWRRAILPHKSVFDGWMNSPGHRANILSDEVHMGVGAATGGNGRMYWTQKFATPA
jgi:uncharacterized protein YkwD